VGQKGCVFLRRPRPPGEISAGGKPTLRLCCRGVSIFPEESLAVEPNTLQQTQPDACQAAAHKAQTNHLHLVYLDATTRTHTHRVGNIRVSTHITRTQDGMCKNMIMMLLFVLVDSFD